MTIKHNHPDYTTQEERRRRLAERKAECREQLRRLRQSNTEAAL